MNSPKIANRWFIACMGVVLQICLGTVYAWSFFQKPIMTAYHWNNTQVAWIFSLAICFLGLSAAWGGINLDKYGPRKLAISGGILFSAGYVLSGLAMFLHSLPLLYLFYGVLGGCGLGLGYVTPVATCAKWFPDKKGFITGMVVMGFGLGALVMSKLFAPILMNLTNSNLPKVFLSIGFIMIILTTSAAFFLINPPSGYVPKGWIPQTSLVEAEIIKKDFTVKKFLWSKNFIFLWLLFFANITAGMMFIGFQSPLLQDLLRKSEAFTALSTVQADVALAAAGATLIAVSSLFNGFGRFFFGALSDKIGRLPTFRLILGSQIMVFFYLPQIQNPVVFSVLVCYVLLCYGGGFGTAPATVLTLFGSSFMPTIYGLLLTAWSAGGIVGPQIVAFIKDSYGLGSSNIIFGIGAGVLAAGFLLTFFVKEKLTEY